MAKWGILWRPLQLSLSQNVRNIEVSMELQNVCIIMFKDLFQNHKITSFTVL